MKYLNILFIWLFFVPILSFAQNNPGFSYQAVARDDQGAIMANTQLDLRFAIIKDNTGTGNGTIIYRERHRPMTNDYGLFTTIVGKGDSLFGVFDNIDWTQSNLFLQVEVDINQDQRYTFMGKTQILPVPLALHAMSADDVDDADADPTNEIQFLQYDSVTNTIALTDGNAIQLPRSGNGVGDADADPTNEIQTINRFGLEVTLSDGGGTISVADNDNDPNNELQSLTRVGDLVSLSDGGGSFVDQTQDADADPQNEIQVIGFDASTNVLMLSNGGGQVDLSSLKSTGNGSGTDDQTLTLNGTVLSIEDGNSIDLATLIPGDNDSDPQNEIQSLSFDTATYILSLSDGNQVDLSSLKSFGNGGTAQNLSLNGSTLGITGGNTVDLSNLPDNVDDADADPQNELQILSFDTASYMLSLSNGNQVDLSTLKDFGSGGTSQNLSLNGSTLGITGGNTVDLSNLPDNVDDADADPTNEIQNISLDTTSNTLSLSDGGNVDLSRYLSSGTDGDSDPQNEIQTLSLDTATNILTLANGGTVDLSKYLDNSLDIDADPGNEIQILSYDVNTRILSLTNGGMVDLSSLLDGVNDADADPQNEIQTLSLDTATNMLTLADGGTIDLSKYLDNSPDGDADPTNELQQVSFDTTSKTLSLSQNGGTIDLSSLSNGGNNSATPWKTVNNGIEYEDGDVNLNVLSVNGFMSDTMAAFLGGTPDNVGLFTLFNKGDKYFDAFVQPNGMGSVDLRNSSFRLFNFDNRLRVGAYIDNDSGLQEFYGANNTLNITVGSANHTNSGYIGLYDENDQLNTSFEIGDEGGLITVRDSSGQAAAITDVASGAGFQYLYGPNGNFNASLGSQLFNADQGALFLFDENGLPLSNIGVNTNGGTLGLTTNKSNASVISVFKDNGGAEFNITNGEFQIFSPDNNLGVLSSTANDAGFLTLYGKNGNPNVGLGSFADLNGPNPNIGAVSVFDTAGLASGLFFAGAEGGEITLMKDLIHTKVRTYIEDAVGKQVLYGANGSTNIQMGRFGSNDRGIITVDDENGLAQATISMTNDGGALQVIRKNGDPGVATYINKDDKAELDLYNGSFKIRNPNDSVAIEANAMNGSGALNVFGSNGNLNAAFGNFFDPNRGNLNLYDETGQLISLNYQDDEGGKWDIFDKNTDGGVAAFIGDGAGQMTLNGPNGKANFKLSTGFTSNNHGLFEVFGDGDFSQFSLAATANGGAFRMAHTDGSGAIEALITQDQNTFFDLYGGTISARTFNNFPAFEASSIKGYGEISLYDANNQEYLSIDAVGANNDNGQMLISNSTGSAVLGLSTNDNGGVFFVTSSNSSASMFAGVNGNDPSRVLMDMFDGDFEVINGEIRTKQDNSTTTGRMYSLASTGQLNLNGSNGNFNVSLGTLPLFGDLNRGYIAVNGTNGLAKSYLSINDQEAGVIQTNGPSGTQNIYIGPNFSFPEYGAMAVADDFGNFKAGLLVDEFGLGSIFSDAYNINDNFGSPILKAERFTNAGQIVLNGSNGSKNVEISSTQNGQRGTMSFYDEAGSLRGGFVIDNNGNGSFFADVKNFKVDHPEDPTKEIWYVSLEGPEAAAYERGTATLKGGEAFIPFSEHYQLIANPEKMTVLVTPLSAESTGLAVVKKTAEGFYVRELFKGTGTYEFDWEVKAVRKGHENFEVIRDKK